jgi:hypothetical protein
MSTEKTESTTRLPAVAGPAPGQPAGGPAESAGFAGSQPAGSAGTHSGQPGQAGESAGPSGGEPPAGPPEQSAEWGAQPPPAAPRSKWTAKRIVIAAVVAVGIAAAGGAAIYAASGSVDNTQGGPGGMRGGPGGGQMIVGGPMAGMQDVQHGEFQTGEVTALSDDSITVKSEDDYEQTYTIDDDTQMMDGIEQGDEVTVIATTENDKATATSVMEFGTMPGGQGNRRDGTDGGNQQPPNGTPPNGNN